MLKATIFGVALAVSTSGAFAQTAPEGSDGEPVAASARATGNDGGVKTLSGMSILGNQEAPKSLVIVPWKSSEIGNGIGVSRALDTSPRAVDKDVFSRELRYYQIRGEKD
jgi:hypothetical protein